MKCAGLLLSTHSGIVNIAVVEQAHRGGWSKTLLGDIVRSERMALVISRRRMRLCKGGEMYANCLSKKTTVWFFYARCKIVVVLCQFSRMLHVQSSCILMVEVMFAPGIEWCWCACQVMTSLTLLQTDAPGGICGRTRRGVKITWRVGDARWNVVWMDRGKSVLGFRLPLLYAICGEL